MTQADREKISALLDGELASAEMRHCVGRLTGDEDLRATWGRYHLIRDVMRGESVHLSRESIVDSVAVALQDEPAIIAAPQRRGVRFPQHWIKPAAGAAIAASVATAVVISLPVFISDVPDHPAVATTKPPPMSIRYADHSGTRWKNLQRPEVESKLNRYLVDHSEYASPGGMTGVLPYASFVSYDENR